MTVLPLLHMQTQTHLQVQLKGLQTYGIPLKEIKSSSISKPITSSSSS